MTTAQSPLATKPTTKPATKPADDAMAARSFLPFMVWLVLAEICALIVWVGAQQPNGMMLLLLDGRMTISYPERLWPLAALLLCGLAAALAVQGSAAAPRIAALPGVFVTRRRLVLALLIGVALAAALSAVSALRGFPNSSDEYDYLFQAWTFAAGRLWNPAPPLPDLFAFFNQTVQEGKWFSTYPPGWPLLLAAAMTLRLPAWLPGPLFGGALLAVVAALARRRDGPTGAVLAVALLVPCAFFTFTAASYFNMLPAALAGLLFCWVALDYLDEPRGATALGAGVALGALGLIRPFDAALFAVVFGADLLRRGRLGHYRLAPVILLGGLPFLGALLLFDFATLGHLLPLEDGSPVRFGLFPVNLQGLQLTPLDELRFVLVRLIMLAEWTSPFLVVGYFAAFWLLARERRLSFLDFIFPAYVLVYLLVPFDGGAQYGPRYYFEAFPFLVLTVVSALAPVLRDTVRPRRASFAVSLVVAHIAAGIAATVVFGLFLRLVIDQRMDVYDQAAAAHLEHAVVVLQSGTSPLRPMWPRDLTRNGIAVEGRVIYVRDIPGQLSELRRLMPDRRFYRYTRDPNSAKGVLQRLP